MNLTSIVNKLYFQPRRRELERYINKGEEMQHEILQYLVKRGKDTEYGRKYLFSTINNYNDFAQNIPLNTYEELKGYIDRMRHGERNILWPGQVKWYAKCRELLMIKVNLFQLRTKVYKMCIIKEEKMFWLTI